MAGKSVFSDFRETGSLMLIFLAKNHPLTKTELTKKISQINPIVPEEIGYTYPCKHMYIEIACCYILEMKKVAINIFSYMW